MGLMASVILKSAFICAMSPSSWAQHFRLQCFMGLAWKHFEQQRQKSWQVFFPTVESYIYQHRKHVWTWSRDCSAGTSRGKSLWKPYRAVANLCNWSCESAGAWLVILEIAPRDECTQELAEVQNIWEEKTQPRRGCLKGVEHFSG